MRRTAAVLGLAGLVSATIAFGALASAYCPPKGPGAPGYCENTPNNSRKQATPRPASTPGEPKPAPAQPAEPKK